MGGSRHVVLALAVLVAGCSSSSSSSSPQADAGPAPPGPTLITTDHGPIQGSAEQTVRQFLGIPFAAPPVGPLRWKPPADHAHWTTPLQTTRPGPACATPATGGGVSSGTSEDCLTLDIWTPLAQTTKAPVMVWIYGGGFVQGDGSDPATNGTNLATNDNVIVVSLNYRLGPLGFLSSTALAAEEGTAVAPSFGLLDQQAAIRWVHDNIAAFGGDPDDVTIFGESAGAWSTCSQLTMPGSMGLFQRAIMESGSCGGLAFYFTAAGAQAQATQLAQALGCTDPSSELSCMRALDAGTVLSGLPGRKDFIGSPGVDWGPVVDGVALPALPLTSIQAKKFANVPVILGTNHDEGNLFTYLWTSDGSSLTASDTLGAAQLLVSTASEAQSIISHYSGPSYPTPSSVLSAIITDGALACPTRRAARAIAGAGGAAYLYQFTHAFSPALAPGLGAAHSFEIPYVFDNVYLGSRPPDADAPLVATMQGTWGRFAQTGDPNGDGVTWPKYTSANDENIVLDLKVTTESGLKKSDCDFWDGLN